MEKAVIGLFGTCGKSTWREPFLQLADLREVTCYNPQLPEGTWKPEYANEYVQQERYHLLHDDIIVFAITDETTAFISLGEIGFSVVDVLRNLGRRQLVVYIAPKCGEIEATASEIKSSNQLRETVSSKLRLETYSHSNVFVVNNLDDLLACTADLIGVVKARDVYEAEVHQMHVNYKFGS